MKMRKMWVEEKDYGKNKGKWKDRRGLNNGKESEIYSTLDNDILRRRLGLARITTPFQYRLNELYVAKSRLFSSGHGKECAKGHPPFTSRPSIRPCQWIEKYQCLQRDNEQTKLDYYGLCHDQTKRLPKVDLPMDGASFGRVSMFAPWEPPHRTHSPGNRPPRR